MLTDDHSKLDQMLKQVLAALRYGSSRQTFDRLDHFWARLGMHIRAEHLHLFPALLGSIRSDERAIKKCGPSFNYVPGVIRELRTDHDHFMKELGGLIKLLRDLIAKEEPDELLKSTKVTERLNDLHARLRAHDQLEETEIYPLVAVMLEPGELITLSLQIKKELENLPPRFVGSANADI